MNEEKRKRLNILKVKYKWRFIQENFYPDWNKIKENGWFYAYAEMFRINANIHKYRHKGMC